jgi:hypothetical protein
MFRRRKSEKLRDNAISASALALALARDRKFRKRLLSALQHGSRARRRTQSGLGLSGAVRRAAADEALHAELKGARDDLQQAYARLDSKRRGSRLRKVFLLVAGASVAAVPRVREAVRAAITKAPQGAERLKDAAGTVSSYVPGQSPSPPTSLENLTKEELYARAQEAEIPGRSEMSKEELVAALRARS